MRLLLYVFVEWLAFALATYNFRACAANRILPTLISDLLISANGFIVVKLVMEASTYFEMGAYVLGAGLGSVTGMLMTRHWGGTS